MQRNMPEHTLLSQALAKEDAVWIKMAKRIRGAMGMLLFQL